VASDGLLLPVMASSGPLHPDGLRLGLEAIGGRRGGQDGVSTGGLPMSAEYRRKDLGKTGEVETNK